MSLRRSVCLPVSHSLVRPLEESHKLLITHSVVLIVTAEKGGLVFCAFLILMSPISTLICILSGSVMSGNYHLCKGCWESFKTFFFSSFFTKASTAKGGKAIGVQLIIDSLSTGTVTDTWFREYLKFMVSRCKKAVASLI